MTNSVDPDETARNEPFHLDLHYLQRYLYWFVWMKGLMTKYSYIKKILKVVVHHCPMKSNRALDGSTNC